MTEETTKTKETKNNDINIQLNIEITKLLTIYKTNGMGVVSIILANFLKNI